MKLLALVLITLAHMHDRADLDGWFQNLHNANNLLCCSLTDATTIKDPDWDSEGDHFRVKLGEGWVDVPDWAVVKGANKYGMALAWTYKDATGKVKIKCFLPGAGT